MAADGSLTDLAVFQQTMVQAVHGDPTAFETTAAAIAPSGGIAAEKRLFLHLNTIDHALLAVLCQAYPATVQLLGDAAFAAAAKAFLRAAPPQRPALSGYGAGFDRFLVEQGLLEERLAAVARLDWAAQEAYFAADAEPLTAEALAGVPEPQHPGLRFVLVPSGRLVPLPAPAAWASWSRAASRAAVAIEPLSPPPGGPLAGALVWRRPDMMVAALPLAAADLVCLAALAGGETLIGAASAAQDAAPDGAEFDLAALLTDCLAGGVFRSPARDGP